MDTSLLSPQLARQLSTPAVLRKLEQVTAGTMSGEKVGITTPEDVQAARDCLDAVQKMHIVVPLLLEARKHNREAVEPLEIAIDAGQAIDHEREYLRLQGQTRQIHMDMFIAARPKAIALASRWRYDTTLLQLSLDELESDDGSKVRACLALVRTIKDRAEAVILEAEYAGGRPADTEPEAVVQDLEEVEKSTDPSTETPSLRRSVRLILLAMSDIDTFVLSTVADIAGAPAPENSVSNRTASQAIKDLIGLHMAERPNGPRGGARLTIYGRQTARRLRLDCAKNAR